VDRQDGLDDAERLTLEKLALSGWPEAAAAQVVSVTVAGNRADVALVVNGDYEYWEYGLRGEEGWIDAGSGNSPSGHT
jgi:hypothetical protein